MSLIRFRRLEAVSFFHSTVYLALLLCAFVLGNPEPETFILGLTHGLLWIGMSLVCILAARLHVIPFWLAVTVAVLGGLGPFAGSIGFVVEERRRAGDGRPHDERGRVGEDQRRGGARGPAGTSDTR